MVERLSLPTSMAEYPILYKILTIKSSPSEAAKKNLNKFNHDEFWETVCLWSSTNLVIISEVEASEDFECIWSYERPNDINKDRSIVEKLFVLKYLGFMT